MASNYIPAFICVNHVVSLPTVNTSNRHLTMKQITLNIPDNQYAFFTELVQKLGLEKVKEESVDTEQQVLQGIAQGLREVKQIEEGKKKGTPLKDFLDEL